MSVLRSRGFYDRGAQRWQWVETPGVGGDDFRGGGGVNGEIRESSQPAYVVLTFPQSTCLTYYRIKLD